MAAPNVVTTTNIRSDGANPDGHQYGASASDPIGFYGATPIVQQASAGQTHTPAAGATTSVFVNTTFDGGVTGKNYTVGDIVLALKNLGLITS